MKDENQRGIVVLRHLVQQRQNLRPEDRVEAADRFIGEDDLGLLSHDAGDGHALLLPSRERVRPLVDLLLETDLANGLPGDLPILGGEAAK